MSVFFYIFPHKLGRSPLPPPHTHICVFARVYVCACKCAFSLHKHILYLNFMYGFIFHKMLLNKSPDKLSYKKSLINLFVSVYFACDKILRSHSITSPKLLTPQSAKGPRGCQCTCNKPSIRPSIFFLVGNPEKKNICPK